MVYKQYTKRNLLELQESKIEIALHQLRVVRDSSTTDIEYDDYSSYIRLLEKELKDVQREIQLEDLYDREVNQYGGIHIENVDTLIIN